MVAMESSLKTGAVALAFLTSFAILTLILLRSETFCVNKQPLRFEAEKPTVPDIKCFHFKLDFLLIKFRNANKDYL